jgi:uncharacterized membrane protein
MNPNIARRRHQKAVQASQADNQHQTADGHSGHAKINVGDVERQLSMIGGTVLAVCGLLRGSISGLGLAAIGGALIWRGHTGHCEVYHMLGQSTAEHRNSHDQSSGAPSKDDTHIHGYESHAAGEAV